MRHVYVHVPFCARRCSYCDFAIAVRRIVPVDEYLAALQGELLARFGAAKPETVDTIYFGGGTPSLLGGEGIARALDIVRGRFPAANGAEITIEANPDDVTPAAVARWKAAGVNRMSLGAQTFNDTVLAWMHRAHDSTTIQRAVAVARDGGITNLSLDLIFALPDALERDFEKDVERLAALHPEHVSLYGLTVEAGTALGKWVADGVTREQPEEGYEREFLAAHRLLRDAGFEHYEVSNYARPGKRAQHNSAYWSGAAYVGLGPSAHGFDGSSRRWNTRHFAAWSEVAGKGIDPVEGSEQLTPANRESESVYLGMRSDVGLPVVASDLTLVVAWVDAGWVVLGPDGRMRCTAEGWLRLDSLATALTHHRSR
ncbi:MAG: radical SAM family heme chaperone HemW [Gemmatimonadota bacterium]|nr:radical SAM family heme chaperone HemW [Gemmatimonadota bacterium]